MAASELKSHGRGATICEVRESHGRLVACILPLLLGFGCALRGAPREEPTEGGSSAPREEPTEGGSGAAVRLIDTPVYKSPKSNEKIGWARLGPGGGGAQFTPTIKPSDPQTALVAADVSDTFITHDGGKSWRMIKLNGSAKSIAFDPADAPTIYVGTNAGTLFRSVDDGQRWSLIYPPASTALGQKYVGDHADYEVVSSDKSWVGYASFIMSIVVDPDEHEHLFMGAGKNNSFEVMRSLDRGGTWSKICSLSGLTGFGGFINMYVDPTSTADDRRLFAFTTDSASIIDTGTQAVQSIMPPLATGLTDASVGVDPASGYPILYVTSGFTYNSTSGAALETGAFRSLTMGQSWEEMKAGLDSDYLAGTDLSFNRVATSPTDASVVYISSQETSDGNFGIFKSIDAGSTWSWALKVPAPDNKAIGWSEADYTPEWAGAPLNMSVSASSPDVLYATDWGTTYRTTDGGGSWENLYCDAYPDGTYRSRGLDVSNSDEIVFDPFDKNHLALVNSSDIGVFESRNGGKTWKHAMNGVPESWRNSCYDLVFDPQVKGKAWSAWARVHDLPRYRYIRQPYNVEQYPGGICVTEDGLGSWQCVSDGLPTNSVPTSIALDPASPAGNRTLYMTVMGRGVYKSTNDGHTWIQKNGGIESNGLNDHVYAWDVVRAQNGTLYLLIARSVRQGTISKTANLNVATVGAVYRSLDGAESWHRLSLPEGVVFPNSMAVDPSNPRRAYLACWPQTIEPEHVERHGGLYRTEDAGDSWINVFDDAAHVYGVAVDPEHTSRVYITTFEGYVLRSDDRGGKWGRLGGFNFKWAKNPILEPSDSHGMMYITTFGGGLWLGPQEGIESIPEDVYPFN